MRETARRSLEKREAAGLRAAGRARVALAALGLLGATLVSSSRVEVGVLYGIGVAYVGVAMWSIRRVARRGPSVRLGFGLTLGDGVVLCALPVLWHLVYSGPNMPLLHLLRHQLIPLLVCMLMVSSMPLQPAYPAFLTGFGSLLQLTLIALALRDPHLQVGHFGVGSGPGDLFLTLAMYAGAGAALTAVVVSARRAVVEAAWLEAEQAELRESQWRLVFDQRMEATSALVAGVAHELNTPLGALQSGSATIARAVDRLSDGQESEAQQRTLGALRVAANAVGDASRRLSEVVTQLRRFVHLDEATQQRVDLSDCVRSAAELSAARAPTTQLVLQLAPGAHVLGDPARLSQAFATLIDNAFDAVAEAGAGAVTVSCRREGERVLAEVRDDGRGMDAAQLGSLFDVEFGGRGRKKARLGMAACRSVVSSHGGEIQVDSRVGKGTRVSLRFPYHDASERPRGRAHDEREGSASAVVR